MNFIMGLIRLFIGVSGVATVPFAGLFVLHALQMGEFGVWVSMVGYSGAILYVGYKLVRFALQ